MVRSKRTTARKTKGRPSASKMHTDWPWVWRCIAEMLGVTLIAVIIATVWLWLFYSQGWVWRVSNALLLLSLLFLAFGPSFFYLYRRFTFEPRPYGEMSPGFALRWMGGILLVLSILNVSLYAKDHFVAGSDVRQITPQTPLDRLGRVGVQELVVDTTRGVGWAFTTDVVHHRYSSEKRFHCFVLVPIKGRANDYWGLHVSERHHSSTGEQRMERYWGEFVERSHRIMPHLYPDDTKRLKRVTNDFDWGGYRMAIQQTFGKQADKPFTVWETEADAPTPLSTHLFWQAVLCVVTMLVAIFVLGAKSVRPEEMLPPIPFRIWWREQRMGSRLIALLPSLLTLIYLIIGEIGGMRLASEDTDSLVRWGAPVRRLMEDGEWWRLLLAPFFPYSYFYFYFCVGMYGLYAWYCELRRHPYFLFAVYWTTSVVAVLFGVTHADPDEMFVPFLGGLFGVWGCHVCILCIHLLRHPFKIKIRGKQPTAWQRIKMQHSVLSSEFSATYILTILLVLLFGVSLFTGSLPYSVVGALMGAIYAVVWPERMEIETG